MKNTFTTLVTVFLGLTAVIANPVAHGQRRAADTCADPSLTTAYGESYSPVNKEHIVSPLWFVVSGDTINGFDLQVQVPVLFYAWETPQDFTFPLYQFFSATTQDIVYLISTTGSPPDAGSGFVLTNPAIVGYVYSTQVCGSVPLLVSFQQTAGDHFYTTDVDQHSSLLANGWTDDGVVAFVLPPDYDQSS